MVFLKNNETKGFKALGDKELVNTILAEKDKEKARQLQEELYDRYADKVYYKAFSLVKNRETAKDVTHDIMVKIFLKLGSYRGDSPFFGWVFAITYNHCVSYLQKQNKLVIEDLDARHFEMSTDEIEKENQELKEMQLTQLERLLDELNESEKLILMMRYQDGMAIKEISETLTIGESAVKMRLKRSRDRLAELFNAIEK